MNHLERLCTWRRSASVCVCVCDLDTSDTGENDPIPSRAENTILCVIKFLPQVYFLPYLRGRHHETLFIHFSLFITSPHTCC